MGLNSNSTTAIADPSPRTHGYTLCTPFCSYGDDYFKAGPIREHRVKAGVIEYLVPWLDIDPNTKDRYKPTWEPEGNVTPDLLTAYRKKAFALKPEYTAGPINVRPLLSKVRKSIARAVTLGRTARRPHMHKLPLVELSLWELAVPFLNMLAAALSTTDAKVTAPDDGACRRADDDAEAQEDGAPRLRVQLPGVHRRAQGHGRPQLRHGPR